MGATFLPFFRAGGAMLARSVLLLGTKTMASAVSARRASLPKHDSICADYQTCGWPHTYDHLLACPFRCGTGFNFCARLKMVAVAAAGWAQCQSLLTRCVFLC